MKPIISTQIKSLMETKTKLPDHIDEYFTKIEGTSQAFQSRELFKAEKDDVDIKTDLSAEQIVLACKLIWNNDFLARKKLKPVFANYVNEFLRLRISLDRKSRGEFVSINQQNNAEQTTGILSNLANITNLKK